MGLLRPHAPLSARRQRPGRWRAPGILALWVALALSVAALAPRHAQARDDAALRYETITTPHFEVHYFSERRDLALRTAQLCEEAHQVLSPLLAWTPASRTHVIIEDKVDTANGSANVYGRNVIRIFGMPPEPEGVLGYYDDWLRILVYHEYVHILHLDTTLGVAPYINLLIGKQINPNQALPRWFIEGLAVHYESARTGTGRIHSSLYRMWLRAEALSGRTFDLGQITGAPAQWPFGSAAYLYGAYFVSWIAQRHGDEFLTRFNALYGSRLIPYSMNQAASELVGESFDQMWPQWTAHAKGQALAEYVAVQAAGRTPLERITREGGGTGWPRRRPGHHAMTFMRDSLREHATFSEVSTLATDPTLAREHLRVDQPAGAGAWTPSGRHWIYSRTMVTRDVYRFNDLFAWDSQTRQEVRLTRFERARDPAISPDGKRLAYVRVVDGTMELVERALDVAGPAGPARVLLSGKAHPWHDERHWQQISTPVYSPDGRSLIVSWWRSDLRQRDLWRLRLDEPGDDPGPEPLMRDEAMDLDPSFGPDGLLYFSSDRDGIYNIYAMDLQTRQTWRLTQELYGLYSPQVSQDGRWIYVTAYGPRGYDLARLAHPGLPKAQAAPSQRVSSWRRFPPVDTSAWTIQDYAPSRWLAPLFFAPDVAVLTTGAGLGGGVTGYDPVGRHAYQLAAGVARAPDLAQWRPSVGLAYEYGGLPLTLSASASYNEYVNLGGLRLNDVLTPFPERRAAARVALGYPILSFDDALTLSLSYAVDHRTYAGGQPVRDLDPGSPRPVEPELGWFNQLTLEVRFSDLDRYAYSISTSEGVELGLQLSLQAPALGSDYTSIGATWSGRLFKEAPWHERHVFTAGLVGGFIETDFRTRRTFALGGQTPQNVLSSLLFQTPTGGLVVRGYDPVAQVGNHYLWLNAEYRFPVWDVEQGFSTLPLFIRQLKGRLFADAGSAYDGFVADADLLVGVGAEVQLSLVVGYYLSGSLRLGYARGLDPELGRDDLYVLFGGGF